MNWWQQHLRVNFNPTLNIRKQVNRISRVPSRLFQTLSKTIARETPRFFQKPRRSQNSFRFTYPWDKKCITWIKNSRFDSEKFVLDAIGIDPGCHPQRRFFPRTPRCIFIWRYHYVSITFLSDADRSSQSGNSPSDVSGSSRKRKSSSKEICNIPYRV